MTDYVHQWHCKDCTSAFLIYIQDKPKACPNCGANNRDTIYKRNELEIETKILE